MGVTLDSLWLGFSVALQPAVLWYAFLGCIDGNAMARKGRAGAALCIAAVGSWIAGTFGVIVLTLIAPPLATIALRFGPPEYTALLALGLLFLAYMSTSSLVRTLLMAALGLLLGMIGIDPLSGHFRFSFD